MGSACGPGVGPGDDPCRLDPQGAIQHRQQRASEVTRRRFGGDGHDVGAEIAEADAIEHLGVRVTRTPLEPATVWELIHSAGGTDGADP